MSGELVRVTAVITESRRAALARWRASAAAAAGRPGLTEGDIIAAMIAALDRTEVTSAVLAALRDGPA
jgi:hypothetical protein